MSALLDLGLGVWGLSFLFTARICHQYTNGTVTSHATWWQETYIAGAVLFPLHTKDADFQFFLGDASGSVGKWIGVLENERCFKMSVEKCSGVRMSGHHRLVVLSVWPTPVYPHSNLAGERALEVAWVLRVVRRQKSALQDPTLKHPGKE